MAEDELVATSVDKQCAHPTCTCVPEHGQEYCSEACRNSAQSSASHLCECGHPGCVGPIS
jgi:hypothetical protein